MFTKAFPTIDPKTLEDLVATAVKKVPARKITLRKDKCGAVHNGIPLHEVPARVAKVVVGDKSVEFELVQNTVVLKQSVKGPITVHYVTRADERAWYELMVAAIHKELTK